MKKWKKPLLIIAIVLASLVALAVVVGVINGLSGANWNFGWVDYRYDDTGYTVGSGTVYGEGITTISLDWIDGRVEVVACQDQFISLTETSDTELTDESLLRYCVSPDGKTLNIKYRASSWYWGVTENRNKKLILRIPEEMLENLIKLQAETVSADVSVKGITVDALNLSSVSGTLQAEKCIAKTIDMKTTSADIAYSGVLTDGGVVQSVSGDVSMVLPKEASFSVKFDTVSGGEARIAFPHKKEGYYYLCNSDESAFLIHVTTTSGELRIEY